ncbi:MAG: cytochrome c3 family protein [Planctomycetota bacterium]|jgi:hypothetical protein
MYKRIACITLGLVALVLPVSTAEAQSHNAANSIDCVDCHFMHSGGLVSRGAEQETLCKTCHNPSDPLAGHLSDIALHVVDGGATIIDCGSCHEVHNPVDTDTQTVLNLSYVRGNTSKYVSGALEPALFEQDPAHFAFDTSPYNGICQSCHTSISRHTNDGIDDSTSLPADNTHEVGSDCMSCHPHLDGFAGSGGGCTDCHNSTKDNGNDGIIRRAVVGEFSLTSHHVLAGTVTNEDCVVCHMEVYGESYHENDVIDLRDPDTGGALTAFSQFTSGNYTYVQDNLCLKCHDSGGAATAYNPSGSIRRPFSSDVGYDVPNVYDALSTSNSFYHPVRGAGTNTFCNSTTMVPGMDGAILTCFDCHTANGHGSSNQRALTDPIDFATIEAATVRSDLSSVSGTFVETFCSNCHLSDVYVSDFSGSKFEFHGADQSQHGAAGGNELGCMGCHAGTVNLIELDAQDNPIYSNGAARGSIHGGNFTWPTGSWTAGETSPSFLLGGFLDGYKLQGSWSNKDGFWKAACGGGQCNHNGGTKYWTPVAD